MLQAGFLTIYSAHFLNMLCLMPQALLLCLSASRARSMDQPSFETTVRWCTEMKPRLPHFEITRHYASYSVTSVDAQSWLKGILWQCVAFSISRLSPIAQLVLFSSSSRTKTGSLFCFAYRTMSSFSFGHISHCNDSGGNV